MPNDPELPAEVTQLTFGRAPREVQQGLRSVQPLGALFSSFGALLSVLFAQCNSLHLVPKMAFLAIFSSNPIPS